VKAAALLPELARRGVLPDVVMNTAGMNAEAAARTPRRLALMHPPHVRSRTLLLPSARLSLLRAARKRRGPLKTVMPHSID